ncbi:MAG: alpha-D-ribose 1-methylphosphonate 5-triphosphate diphosphatase [Pseudomonadota bacterium]
MTILANARLVLPSEVIVGSVALKAGKIAGIDQGSTVPTGAIDCDGDFLCPGLIELHTDNLERHMYPRPRVEWPHDAAIVAHDAELASVGITTVFDALRIGSILSNEKVRYVQYARNMASEILANRARGALRISHFLHLRAEICSETLLEELAEFHPEDRVGIVSLMDHTPGQRQFTDISKHRQYVMGKYMNSEAEYEKYLEWLRALQARVGATHEAAAVARGKQLGAILASHDDTTEAHVNTSASHGVVLAEFPTSIEAARASHHSGIAVMMGAPNLIRGGSHSGNVAAEELADAGLLDILSSDYVPASLLTAALRLGERLGDLSRGLAAVTRAPARAVGLSDRGILEGGARADLLRFRTVGGVPVTRGLWVQGNRVA